jgi:hypothetical protein
MPTESSQQQSGSATTRHSDLATLTEARAACLRLQQDIRQGERADSYDAGLVAATLLEAEDTLFDALNTLHHHLGDTAAGAEIERFKFSDGYRDR